MRKRQRRITTRCKRHKLKIKENRMSEASENEKRDSAYVYQVSILFRRAPIQQEGPRCLNCLLMLRGRCAFNGFRCTFYCGDACWSCRSKMTQLCARRRRRIGKGKRKAILRPVNNKIDKTRFKKF